MKTINNKTGKTFTPSMVGAGYTVILIGLLIIFSGHYISGAIILLVGGFIALSYNGIEIDDISGRYRSYTSIYGVKFGEWKTTNEFPYISVLKKTESTTAHSRANIASTTSRETFYEVCLLNKTHRKKLVLKRAYTPEEANEFAEKLTTFLDAEITIYKPVLSQKTINRRRR